MTTHFNSSQDDSLLCGKAAQNLRTLQDRALSASTAPSSQDISLLVAGAKKKHRRIIFRRRVLGASSGVLALAGLAFWLQVPAFDGASGTLVGGPALTAAPGASALPGASAFVIEPGLDAAGVNRGQGIPGQAGQLISADGSPQALRFYDATRVVLAEGSRLRVEALSERGASLQLLTGTVDVSVTHTGKSDWHVLAGPYNVHVVGTVFQIRYSKEAQTFEARVESGAIDVSGPAPFVTRRLEAGEALKIGPDLGADGAQAPSGPRSHAAGAKAHGLDAATKASPNSSWRELAKSGDFRKSMAAVESRGYERTVSEMSVVDLLALSDVARLAGQPARASNLLEQVRQRAPGTPHAATAAYSLATTAFDQSGNYALAAKWFQTYLSESPNGALAGAALGRLMESQARGGLADAARASARRYLKSYPKGSHNAFAQSLLEKQTGPR